MGGGMAMPGTYSKGKSGCCGGKEKLEVERGELLELGGVPSPLLCSDSRDRGTHTGMGWG